jgi:hypothetical protein
MDLETARKIVISDAASFDDQTEAAALISSSADSSFEDLLTCLRFPGLPAEFAAMVLYRRTKRPRGAGAMGLVLEADDWRVYLSKSMLARSS